MLAGRDHNTLSQLLREAKETAQEMVKNNNNNKN